jgi:hypothetical protein
MTTRAEEQAWRPIETAPRKPFEMVHLWNKETTWHAHGLLARERARMGMELERLW